MLPHRDVLAGLAVDALLPFLLLLCSERGSPNRYVKLR
jgi:hypothetical protein